MIIECPACATRFGAPDAAFAFGARKVRCSQCGHLWRYDPNAVAAEPGSEPDVQSDPSPEIITVETDDMAEPVDDAVPPITSGGPLDDMVALSSQVPAATRFAAFAVPLIAAFVIATGAGWGAWHYRDAVVAAFPAARPIYAAWLSDATGATNPTGLEISQSETVAGGGRTLTVAGRIVNTAKQAQIVPEMRAVLVGKDQQVLESWTFRAPVSQLQPGQSTPFETRIEARSDAAAEVKISFVEAADSR